jgi:hypothetical protein
MTRKVSRLPLLCWLLGHRWAVRVRTLYGSELTRRACRRPGCSALQERWPGEQWRAL